MNGIFVAITVADGYLLHGCAVAPIEQRLDECLDAPPREQAPHPGSGLLSNLFAIRHRLLDQALWRRPLARRGRRVQRVAGSSHLNASNSNSGADLERQLVSRNSDSSHKSRAGHPGWLRCSSLTYSRYARSSRLAIRAPRSG